MKQSWGGAEESYRAEDRQEEVPEGEEGASGDLGMNSEW